MWGCGESDLLSFEVGKLQATKVSAGKGNYGVTEAFLNELI